MAKMQRGPEIIQIGAERKPATIICGKCKGEIVIDIMPFAKDVSNIMKDKCPKCGADIHVGILILSHPKMEGILQCIKIVVNALNPGNMNLIKKG